MVIKDDIVTFL